MGLTSIIGIVLAILSGIIGLLTLMHRFVFNWKSFNISRLKNVYEALSKATSLPEKQLAYAMWIGYYPSRAEIDFFENELQGSLKEIKEYIAWRKSFPLREADKKLVFNSSNLIYWFRNISLVASILYGLCFCFDMSIYLQNHFPSRSIIYISNNEYMLISFIISFEFALCYFGLNWSLNHWKKIDPAIKDENTSPLTITDIYKKMFT
jgi:hypothetical protein